MNGLPPIGSDIGVASSLGLQGRFVRPFLAIERAMCG